VSDLLKKDDRELAAFLDLDRLRSLHEHRLAGPIRLGDERALWRGVSLALWLDGRRRARATSPRFRHSSSISPRSSNSLQ
jgi:hypothetical protein